MTILNSNQSDFSWVTARQDKPNPYWSGTYDPNSTASQNFSGFQYLAANHDVHAVVNSPSTTFAPLANKPLSPISQTNLDNINLAFNSLNSLIGNLPNKDIVVGYVNGGQGGGATE